MLRSFQIILISLYGFSEAIAQERRSTRASNALWTETVVAQRLSTQWAAQLDFQYRRRGEWYHTAASSANLAKLPLQTVFRPWLQYSLSQMPLRIALSPLGYWRNYNVSDKGEESISHELRTSFQIAYSLRHKLQTQFRLRYELRYRSGDVVSEKESFRLAGADFPISPQVSRLRFQTRLTHPLGRSEESMCYGALSTEWFLGLGSSVKKGDLTDQSRNLLAVGLRLSRQVRIETGYMLHWVMRQSDTQINHCLLFQAFIENPFTRADP